MNDKVVDVLKSELDIAIDVFTNCEVGSEDYKKYAKVVRKLNESIHDLEEKEEAKKPWNRFKRFVSQPLVFSVLANLLAVLLILNYERTEILTSKAMSAVKFK